MKVRFRQTIFTLPGLTYFWTSCGKTLSVYCLQNGHWRSANSYSVTFACGFPSVTPVWAIPVKRLSVGLPDATFGFLSPELETATAIAAIAIATTTVAPTCHRRRLRRCFA